MMVIACLLTALNVLVLAISISQPSRAVTSSYQSLIDDPDFARAVKTIAEQCRVNVDLGKLQC